MRLSTVVPLPGLDLPVPAWRLAPGVRMLWRGDGSFHLEGPAGGVVVTGLDRRVATTLARPHRTGALARPAPGPRPDPVDVEALHRLAALGYLRQEWTADGPDPIPVTPDPATDDPTTDDPAPDDPAAVRRTPPDLHPGAARRLTRVDVVGLSSVAPYIGALLGAAGVGSVGFGSAGVVRRRHLLPGGLAPADEGRRFAAAAADVVARAAPRTTAAPPSEGEPDLTVVCLEAPMEPELRELLHRTRRAHLAVQLDATQGEVGPLVLPGVSACLRCADLHRLDHDPAWSVLAVQLMSQADTAPVPDPALAARVGALAAAAAVAWLDDDPTAGGTVEGSFTVRAGWTAPRRRRRGAHPECGCRAAWGV